MTDQRSSDDWNSVPRNDPPAQTEHAQIGLRNGADKGVDAGQADMPRVTDPARPAGRPAPQYGEYAPDGWVNPVLTEQSRREETAAQARPFESGTAAPRQLRDSRSDSLRPSSAAPDAVRIRGFGVSNGDVFLTVALLAIGIMTVVQQLSGIGTLAAEIAAEIGDRYTALTHPEALVPATVIIAVSGAVILVAAGWWSYSRMRRRKRAFWVPLLAGAVEFLTTGVVYAVVIANDPALVAWFSTHTGG